MRLNGPSPSRPVRSDHPVAVVVPDPDSVDWTDPARELGIELLVRGHLDGVHLLAPVGVDAFAVDEVDLAGV